VAVADAAADVAAREVLAASTEVWIEEKPAVTAEENALPAPASCVAVLVGSCEARNLDQVNVQPTHWTGGERTLTSGFGNLLMRLQSLLLMLRP